MVLFHAVRPCRGPHFDKGCMGIATILGQLLQLWIISLNETKTSGEIFIVDADDRFV